MLHRQFEYTLLRPLLPQKGSAWLLAGLVVFMLLPIGCLSRGWSQESGVNPPAGSRIIGDRAIKEQFDRGAKTVRVIVSLRESENDYSSDEARQRYLERVIATLSSEIQVMDVFRFQSAFSARATRQGMRELIRHPDVMRVQADVISRPTSLSAPQ